MTVNQIFDRGRRKNIVLQSLPRFAPGHALPPTARWCVCYCAVKGTEEGSGTRPNGIVRKRAVPVTGPFPPGLGHQFRGSGNIGVPRGSSPDPARHALVPKCGGAHSPYEDLLALGREILTSLDRRDDGGIFA